MSDKHIKILLVEDDAGYVRLVQKMLAASSQVEYQLECADRLSTGLEHFVNGGINVVLLDLGLPDSQGLDTLSKVRTKAPAVPIVVMTGLNDEMLAIQAVRQGAQDYLVKGEIDGKTLWRALHYAVERNRAEEALRESEERYRALLELGPEVGEAVVMLQDTEQSSAIHVFVNNGWPGITGYSREELLGMSFFDLVHPKHCEVSLERHQRKMGGESVPGLFEVSIIRKDGVEVPIELTSAHTTYRGKRANVAYIRDITERKKMQAQLIQAEKMSAVGVMAAGVAHELLNPMMGMLNFAQYCREHTAEEDTKYAVLQDIERETMRCADIVKNLTTFSRMEKQGDEGSQKESFATVIDRVVTLLSYRIGKDHVTLIQHIDEEAPEIWMEVNSMQQVFLNLISNALDAIEESEGSEIRIEVHRDGEFAEVTVTDSGRGIAPDNLEKIYDPFFTTKPIGQGTGLGLTVARSIIDLHGGDITCESKPGAGTTFKIRLPVERKERGEQNE